MEEVEQIKGRIYLYLHKKSVSELSHTQVNLKINHNIYSGYNFSKSRLFK